jgi:hypothetical protein
VKRLSAPYHSLQRPLIEDYVLTSNAGNLRYPKRQEQIGHFSLPIQRLVRSHIWLGNT